MPSQNDWPTNWPELYHSLNLQPDTHALYVVDYELKPDPHILQQKPKVFIISGEGNTNQYRHYARPGVWFFDSIVSDQYPDTLPWMFHFDKVTHVNQALGFAMTSQPQTEKKFDVLLGLKKLHRDMAYAFLQSQPDLLAKSFLTYYGLDKKFVPGYEQKLTPIVIGWSSENITINNVVAWRSQIMPMDVYCETCYSVICETEAEATGYSFFTEKIAKPMLAARPFVVLANKYYLRRLRQLGFETFDGIINESYDVESDPNIRWQKALDQMIWLNSQNASQIYQDLEQKLRHNQNLMQTNWQQKLADQVAKLV